MIFTSLVSAHLEHIFLVYIKITQRDGIVVSLTFEVSGLKNRTTVSYDGYLISSNGESHTLLELSRLST